MLQSTRRLSLRRAVLLGVPLAALALGACARGKGDLVVDDSVGVTALRSACPVVAIPDYTGDVTLFSDPARKDAAALDVVATITNLRSQCSDAGSGEKIYSQATFDVIGTRSDARGARRVELPYFSSVVRGGNLVIAKRLGTVVLDFADGQTRTTARGTAGAYVDRAEASLPPEIRQKLGRKRKAGDSDAAIDPLAQPDVRTAIAKATFELLVGFQLSNDQLAYNVTR